MLVVDQDSLVVHVISNVIDLKLYRFNRNSMFG